MVVYIIIIIIIIIIYYVYGSQCKCLTAHYSSSTERNYTIFGQCGESMSTKQFFHFGSNRTSDPPFFSMLKKHTFTCTSVLAATLGFGAL